MPLKRWSKEEEKRLKKLLKQTTHIIELSKLMGWHEEILKRELRAMGLKWTTNRSNPEKRKNWERYPDKENAKGWRTRSVDALAENKKRCRPRPALIPAKAAPPKPKRRCRVIWKREIQLKLFEVVA